VDMKKEYVVLVDDNDKPIGKELKSKVHHADTPLHRAFSVFILNSRGELLLQQRGRTKKTWPLVWSNSCCGHPGPGESRDEAATRRLREELGLHHVKLWNVLPDYRYRAELQGVVENEICPVFVGFTSEKPNPRQGEVEAIEWIRWDEFISQVKRNTDDYSPWCVEEAQQLNESPQFNQLLSENTNEAGIC
jgi:isopentenyl-diphosphate Delta-isomerase